MENTIAKLHFCTLISSTRGLTAPKTPLSYVFIHCICGILSVYGEKTFDVIVWESHLFLWGNVYVCSQGVKLSLVVCNRGMWRSDCSVFVQGELLCKVDFGPHSSALIWNSQSFARSLTHPETIAALLSAVLSPKNLNALKHLYTQWNVKLIYSSYLQSV